MVAAWKKRHSVAWPLPFMFAIALLLAATILPPGRAQAAVCEVTLFPTAAAVTETLTVAPQPAGEFKKAVFRLPVAADPDSLVTRVVDAPAVGITDQRWEKVSVIDTARIAALRRQLAQLHEERAAVQAAVQGLEMQLQFWQLQTKAKLRNLADVQNMVAAIGKNVRRLAQERAAQEHQLEKIDKKISELKDELDRTAGTAETAWEVTILLAGTTRPEVSLTCSYRLDGCGWRPRYRLEALPRMGQVSFSWDAELWQSSGRDWEQVELSLATMQPNVEIVPSPLPSWEIKPVPPLVYKTQRQADMAQAAPSPAAELSPSAPQQERKTTFSLWKIGKATVPTGSRQITRVTEELWPATFTHLARPAVGPQVFVRAVVTFPTARELPSGEALILIDGALIAKRTFSLADREAQLAFGVDPFVTAVIQLLAEKGGEKTFLADKQTHVWDWRIEVSNKGAAPVSVRVEELKAQVRDERIKLQVKTDPPPTEEDYARLIWQLKVPAAGKTVIQEQVRLEAPADMEIDLGWRR